MTACNLPAGKPTWQWKIPIVNRKHIFKWSIFQVAMLVYQSVLHHVLNPFYSVIHLLFHAFHFFQSCCILHHQTKLVPFLLAGQQGRPC